MAHFILEYSANLDSETIDVAGLFAKLHASADASGVFPLKGLRSRAVRCDEYRVGDGNPDNAFVNLSMRVGAGRDVEARQRVGKDLFDVLVDHLQKPYETRGFAISFEMRELNTDVKFNQNNLKAPGA